MTYTKLIVLGYLVADAVLRPTQKGMKVANFTVKTNRVYRHDAEIKSTSAICDWTAFGVMAKIVEPLEKGTLLLLEGYLANERWTDQYGQKRIKVKFVAERVKILKRPTVAASHSQNSAEVAK